MNKLLTIIVPVRNRASLVGRTLDSIAASDTQAFELIIVDNGSEDNSLEVCRQWAARAREGGISVRVVEEPRGGASIARNAGLRLCETDFVYFFDSDDLMSADFVSCIVPELREDVDMICVPVRQEVGGKVLTRSYKPTSDVHTHVLNSMLDTLSMVFRTSFLRGIGGWDEELTTWDDWELGVRALCDKPRLRWLRGRAFHHVTVHAASQTGTSFSSHIDSIIRAMSAARDDIAEAMLTTSERVAAQRALYLRWMLIEGQLRREGLNKEGAGYAWESGYEARLLLRWAGKALRSYTGLGGRGGWRAALLLT